MRTLIYACLLAALCGRAELSGEISTWKDYRKVSFSVGERDAWVVQPKEPLAGNPWVWRARFPGWHVEMDELLLADGVAVAYVDVAGMFGSPQAVAIWDAFHAHLTANGYAPKPALEGVSRGALIAYNWAKKNPNKVACIYAEGAACDLSSWPGGKGIGKGGAKEWAQAQAAYGLTEAELLAWNDNPKDNLEALAKAKVPVLHMVGPDDEIVPNVENTFVLVQNYVQLGGIATIWGNTAGVHKLDGHHYPIEDPRYGADFILTNLKRANPAKKSYVVPRDGWHNSKVLVAQKKPLRVAFMGGSITTMAWPKLLSKKLVETYPDVAFDFVHAGIPSMGSTPHAFRLERDVFKQGKVDVLFLEAAVNDSANGRTPVEIRRAMEGIVRHVRRHNPEIDVVFMHFADPDKTRDYAAGKTPMVIAEQETVAKHYALPSLNLALEVKERMDAGEFSWNKDFKNLHPSPFGQKLYAESMFAMIQSLWGGLVDADDKMAAYDLPAAMDPQCYDQGRFIAVDQATLSEGWKIDPNWRPAKGATRPGFVNVPMLVSETPGAELTVAFEGRAIGIFVAAGYDAGIVEYAVDGGAWERRNLLTKWSRGLHLPWCQVLAADLKPGPHVLKLRLAESKGAESACRIQSFVVNGD